MTPPEPTEHDPSPLDGLLEPGARDYDVQTSIAISLKRIADRMDQSDIGEQIERGLANGSVYAAEIVARRFGR